MNAPARGWGLDALPGAAWHWSARAILRDGAVDLVWDRQGVEGEASEEDRKAIGAWLDAKAIPLLRAEARTVDPGSHAWIEFAGDGYRLRASPRRSFGYLYLSAAPDPSATAPTPRPPRKPRSPRRRRAR